MKFNISFVRTMMNVKQFYDLVVRLKYITRFSLLPRVKNESVAEHSFFVVLIVIKLHNYFNFDLKEALTYAVSHDIPEYATSDIPFNLKRHSSKLANELNRLELETLELFPSVIYTGYKKYKNQETVESQIVKLADIIQSILYLENEVQLGNKEVMNPIVNDSYERAKKIFTDLEGYQR